MSNSIDVRIILHIAENLVGDILSEYACKEYDLYYEWCLQQMNKHGVKILFIGWSTSPSEVKIENYICNYNGRWSEKSLPHKLIREILRLNYEPRKALKEFFKRGYGFIDWIHCGKTNEEKIKRIIEKHRPHKVILLIPGKYRADPLTRKLKEFIETLKTQYGFEYHVKSPWSNNEAAELANIIFGDQNR